MKNINMKNMLYILGKKNIEKLLKFYLSNLNKKNKRNIFAATIIGFLLLTFVYVSLFHLLSFVFICLIFSIWGILEFKKALRTKNIFIFHLPIIFSTLLIHFFAYIGSFKQVIICFTLSSLILTFLLFFNNKLFFINILANLFTLFWIPFMMSFAILIAKSQHGISVLFLLLTLIVASDTFGYITGSLFGKHALAPNISPSKSWEGVFGSMLGTFLIGTLFSIFFLNECWYKYLIPELTIVSIATFGDLVESMIKRILNLKDMDNILPGHGGILDRLDSILFNLPIFYIYFQLI